MAGREKTAGVVREIDAAYLSLNISLCCEIVFRLIQFTSCWFCIVKIAILERVNIYCGLQMPDLL